MGDKLAQSLISGNVLELSLIHILPKGRFRERGAASVPIGDSGLTLTRNDIAQLLLAKGAIRAGMDTLLQHCKVEYQDLDHIVSVSYTHLDVYKRQVQSVLRQLLYQGQHPEEPCSPGRKRPEMGP